MMKILYLSPSIKGVQARLVRLTIANREASGPRYALEESDDGLNFRAAVYNGEDPKPKEFESLLTARMHFQWWLDEHYPGVKREYCCASGREPEPDAADVRSETEADQCRRMAEDLRHVPGGHGEVIDYLTNRATLLDRTEAKATEALVTTQR